MFGEAVILEDFSVIQGIYKAEYSVSTDIGLAPNIRRTYFRLKVPTDKIGTLAVSQHLTVRNLTFWVRDCDQDPDGWNHYVIAPDYDRALLVAAG